MWKGTYQHTCALQVDKHIQWPYGHQLDILQTLANNCEGQPFEKDCQLRHRAAAWRQKLFAEMVKQAHPVPKRCVLCQGRCSAHKPSASKDGPKTKVFVGSCLHLYHKTCLQKRGSTAMCPIDNIEL